ncbi:hypothetical protein N7532_001731 [Penicillium argentinense]|uniref:Uncharacterized protein n=1 Tax=Penicillium argentinense TaxID=1131581 RepID=A0A9W9KMQ9_9EURO|nr:uncharacterized protein N7532_001731 [Penicillium argentinense]KAJ5111196.1 hypothetical protein N7532_001731 [Penicillium argentinense]
MAQNSNNCGRHDFKVNDRLNVQNSNVERDGAVPDVHSEFQQHHGKGGASENNECPHIREQRADPTNNGVREDIAASNRFMPQAGKPAGVYSNQEEGYASEEAPEEDRRRKDIPASNRFMPQAGKPTGTSLL